MSDDAWYRLAFTADDVIGSWQDQRLARVCTEAWEAVGRPPGLAILQAPAAEERWVLCWYVPRSLGDLLDARAVPWRRFLVGTCGHPPLEARAAVLLE
jgi:hypothetical protein